MSTLNEIEAAVSQLPADELEQFRQWFAEFDAEKRFGTAAIEVRESELCIAGEILQGLRRPTDCPRFGRECTPERPLGAPMVSGEGTCAAYYRYGREP